MHVSHGTPPSPLPGYSRASLRPVPVTSQEEERHGCGLSPNGKSVPTATAVLRGGGLCGLGGDGCSRERRVSQSLAPSPHLDPGLSLTVTIRQVLGLHEVRFQHLKAHEHLSQQHHKVDLEAEGRVSPGDPWSWMSTCPYARKGLTLRGGGT